MVIITILLLFLFSGEAPPLPGKSKSEGPGQEEAANFLHQMDPEAEYRKQQKKKLDEKKDQPPPTQDMSQVQKQAVTPDKFTPPSAAHGLQGSQEIEQRKKAAANSRTSVNLNRGGGNSSRPAATQTSSMEGMPNLRGQTDAALAALGGIQGQLAGMNQDNYTAQNRQNAKEAFMRGQQGDAQTLNKHSLTQPPSKYTLLTGGIIPVVLLSAVKSDLPGEVVAQAREDVYDTASGKYVLIPRGTRFVGVYDSKVTFGQDRVLLAWTRMLLPNGETMVLERFSGMDVRGQSGLEDGVDRHIFRIVGASLVSAILSVGSNAVNGNLTTPVTEQSILQNLGSQAGTGINNAGQQYVSKAINVQPTLYVREGFKFNIFVNKDLVLKPYRER